MDFGAKIAIFRHFNKNKDIFLYVKKCPVPFTGTGHHKRMNYIILFTRNNIQS